jgi:hypothetical protein
MAVGFPIEKEIFQGMEPPRRPGDYGPNPYDNTPYDSGDAAAALMGAMMFEVRYTVWLWITLLFLICSMAAAVWKLFPGGRPVVAVPTPNPSSAV